MTCFDTEADLKDVLSLTYWHRQYLFPHSGCWATRCLMGKSLPYTEAECLKWWYQSLDRHASACCYFHLHALLSEHSWITIYSPRSHLWVQSWDKPKTNNRRGPSKIVLSLWSRDSSLVSGKGSKSALYITRWQARSLQIDVAGDRSQAAVHVHFKGLELTVAI